MSRSRSFLLSVLLCLMVGFIGSPVIAFDYPSILEEKSKSIVPIKFTVKMTVTRKGKSHTRDLSGTANGVLVGKKGLLLVSARQLKGPGMFQRMKRPGFSMETTPKNFQVRMPDGTWLDAKLSAKDSGLDLAFIEVNKDVSTFDGINPVSLPKRSPDLKVGEPVVHVSRSGEELNYEPHLLATRINGVISDPRLRYFLQDGAGMLASYIGSPAFNDEGTFIGMATFRGGTNPGGSSRGRGANPYAMMSQNQQFLLPVDKIQSALKRFQSRQGTTR